MKKSHVIIGVIVVIVLGILWYYKPWRKQSKDVLHLSELEKQRINALVEGGQGYTYEEALEEILKQRITDIETLT